MLASDGENRCGDLLIVGSIATDPRKNCGTYAGLGPKHNSRTVCGLRYENRGMWKRPTFDACAAFIPTCQRLSIHFCFSFVLLPTSENQSRKALRREQTAEKPPDHRARLRYASSPTELKSNFRPSRRVNLNFL